MLPLPKHAFRDLKDRIWLLIMNYGLAKRILAAFPGVDFANAHNGQALQALAQSDELLVCVLFAIVEDQAKAANVSPEDFAEALAGEQFEAAGNAIGEMITLFTRPGIRPVIEQMFAMGTAARTAAIELATKKLSGPSVQAAIDREMQRLDQQLEEALMNPSIAISSSTSGPPSPE